MKLSLRITALLCMGLVFLIINSCKHDSGPSATSVKKWSGLVLKAINEVPAPAGRNEEGDANIELMSDNSLKWDLHIHNLKAGDALTAAHIHTGDAVTAGPVFINLNPTFSAGGASGTVTGLRQSQIDSLLTMPIYVNVHSTQAPGGIARSQMDKTISFAVDISLLGANEPTPVNTTATGLAVLRLTSGDTLFSNVSFANLEANDTMTLAHVHRGAVGVSGPVRINLALATTEFAVTRKQFLVDSLKNMLLNDAVYVNEHSKRNPGGKIRGQIR